MPGSTTPSAVEPERTFTEMDAHRWQRIDELFQAAIARAAEERRAFLDEACAGDDGLRQQLDRLVRAHERSSGFLETPVATDALRILASADDSSAVQSPLTSFRAGTEFRGTERFTVRRQLGAGGMGVVYEVHDQVRDEVVALKTLLRARAADIYRLKREFRSLADVAHPNLVSLYELVVDGADCFFTMELVHGVNLVEYVRGSAATRRSMRSGSGMSSGSSSKGFGALHRRGKLHRDIKPSNILITPDGRVVILDFGLAGDVVPDDAAVGESMAGTPAYLAPERRAGAAPSEGHDWYSVGVTLYEALTGRVPFDGPFEDVLRRKRETDPCPPAEIAAGRAGGLERHLHGPAAPRSDAANVWPGSRPDTRTGFRAERRGAPVTGGRGTAVRRPPPTTGRAGDGLEGSEARHARRPSMCMARPALARAPSSNASSIAC